MRKKTADDAETSRLKPASNEVLKHASFPRSLILHEPREAHRRQNCLQPLHLFTGMEFPTAPSPSIVIENEG